MIDLLCRRIALKLTLTLVGLVAVVMVVAGIYLDVALSSFATETLEARLVTAGRLLHDEARALVAGGATVASVEAFATRAAQPTGLRVTVIARDGRVLGDSGVPPDELAGVENHADRPEVKEALRGAPGRDLRTSATVHEPLFYVGLPIRDGARVIGVLRLALPLSVVTASHRAIARTLLAGGIVALVVAAGIGVLVSRQITKPVVEMEGIARRMSEGDFAARVPVRSTDEIGTLARALNTLAAGLRDKIEDLEHEHAKVATILDTMVEGVIAVDGDDDVLVINEPARALFDVPRGTGERKPLLEVVRNADLHAIVRVARAGEDDTAVGREIVLAHRTRRRLQVHAMPLRLGAAPPGVVLVLHDVTEVRRLEQVRTEFVANVSHELRTPLTAIQGYVETLLAGGVDEEAERRFLEIVHRHTERLGRLLNDLTDLSNIELGRVVLDLEPTSVADVVDSVLAVVRRRAEAHRVGVDDVLPSDLPPVVADHDRLQQILINLVDNAVKYTPEGGRVAVTAVVVAPGMVEVSVVDTGIGIPPADIPRVTERFYRVDRARSRELGGTGLGLAIVKHLVHAHGGTLTLESEPGRGTTVRFTLPVAET